MSGRERQAQSLETQSLGWGPQRTARWVMNRPVFTCPPRTAHPLLPLQSDDPWWSRGGPLGGEDLGEMSGEKTGDYWMDQGWWLLSGRPCWLQSGPEEEPVCCLHWQFYRLKNKAFLPDPSEKLTWEWKGVSAKWCSGQWFPKHLLGTEERKSPKLGKW